MKVMIQSDTNALLIPRSLQHREIICLFHSDLRNMNSIKHLFAKDRRRVWGEPLVQQKSVHATR